MRLVSLNTWGGRAMYPLMRFLERQAPSTDIFCLQEIFNADRDEIERKHPREYVRGDLLQKIGEVLPGFTGFFADFKDNPMRQSLAIFLKYGIKVIRAGDCVVYVPKVPKEEGSRVISSRKLQYLIISDGYTEHTIYNFHGLWFDGPKTDTDDRIRQSLAIRSVLSADPRPKLLCGDFNLLPDTESMGLLEKGGLHNLVTEKGARSTRTVLYRHYQDPNCPNFADYILISNGIRVRRFEVMPDICSDHSPLSLEYSVFSPIPAAAHPRPFY